MTDRRAELEAAIEADPYDPRAYAVLADHLQELGDPRGELIALALAAESDPALARVVAERAAPGSVFWPWPRLELHPGWWRGFVRSATFTTQERATFAALLEHPSGRFLRELGLPGGPDLAAQLARLTATPRPSMRALTVGYSMTHGRQPVGELGVIWRALPQLTGLTVYGRDAELGAVDAPELCELHLDLANTSSVAEAIARARCPKLERLVIELPPCHGAAVASTLAALRTLLSANLPALHTLAFPTANGSDFSLGLLELLVELPVTRGLRWLPLGSGCLDDRGAELIERHADAFAHLQLDLSRNQLSAAGVARLRPFQNVDTTEQHPVDRDDTLYDY